MISKHNRKNEYLQKINSSFEITTEILENKNEYEQTCPNNSDEKIREYFYDKNIIWLKQSIDHDGYDYYGPKSDLYDLYFIEKLDDNYIFYNYHTENWFSKRDNYKTYFLYKKKIFNKIEMQKLEESGWINYVRDILYKSNNK